MEVYCKRCNKSVSLKDGLCPECRPELSISQSFFGRFQDLYSTFSRRVTKSDENTDSSDLESRFKKLKRSESVFTRIKRFYRNITEDEPTESDSSESTEFLEPREEYDLFKPLEGSKTVIFFDSKGKNDVLGYNRELPWRSKSEDAGPMVRSDRSLEPSNICPYEPDSTFDEPINQVENDLLKSFSSLSVQIRNEELEKIHDVLKRYKDRDHKLTEKLLKNDYKVEDYDYLPKVGEKDHDLWDLKLKDEQAEYLKLLFFRDSHSKRYTLEEIQGSLNRVKYSSGTLVDKFGIEINKSNISCLFETNWLNDEIINFYLQILQEQNELMRLKHELPSCFFFNTFFFQALCGNEVPGVFYDYKSVARWTKRKKVNIFEKDLLIVPVHVSKVHWALGVVDMRKKWRRIMIFDSLGGNNPTWFKNIRRWLMDEHKDKLNRILEEIDDWKIPKNYRAEPYAPSQKNTYDCGLFLCQFAKGISFATGFNFTNESSSYLRKAMIHEILSCKVSV